MSKQTQPTANEIEDHFEAAKKICKSLLPVSERGKRRILNYFFDLIQEEGDMDRELTILRAVAQELGMRE